MQDGRLSPDAEVVDAQTEARILVRQLIGTVPPPAVQPSPRFSNQPEFGEAPAPKRSNTGIIITIVVVGLFGFCCCGGGGASILFPVFAKAKYEANMSNNLTSTREVYTALLIYAADYDEKLPPVGSGPEIESLLSPYLADDDLNERLYRESIGINPKLAGITTDQLTAMEDTIAIWYIPEVGTTRGSIVLTTGEVLDVEISVLKTKVAAGDFSTVGLNHAYEQQD